MGRRVEYRRGFEQFQQFMAAARGNETTGGSIEAETVALVRRLILELATETFEGNPQERQMALELIRSRQQWQEEHERLSAEMKDALGEVAELEFVLKRDNTVLEPIRISGKAGVACVSGLEPGVYSLFFETGRPIWQRELSESHLLWAAAYPNEPLELAADTDAASNRPTLEERVLDGEVTIRVFAGFECGQLEIELRSFEKPEAKK